ALVVQGHVGVDVVGVVVVPGHDLGGRGAAGEVGARDPQRAVGAGAGGVDDGVVVHGQFAGRDIRAHVDAQPVGETGLVLDRGEQVGHRAGVHVVGRHAVPGQPVGDRQAIEHRDLHFL